LLGIRIEIGQSARSAPPQLTTQTTIHRYRLRSTISVPHLASSPTLRVRDLIPPVSPSPRRALQAELRFHRSPLFAAGDMARGHSSTQGAFAGGNTPPLFAFLFGGNRRRLPAILTAVGDFLISPASAAHKSLGADDSVSPGYCVLGPLVHSPHLGPSRPQQGRRFVAYQTRLRQVIRLDAL